MSQEKFENIVKFKCQNFIKATLKKKKMRKLKYFNHWTQN